MCLLSAAALSAIDVTIAQILMHVKQMCFFCEACQQHHQICCPDLALPVAHRLCIPMTSKLASLQRPVMTYPVQGAS